MWGLLSMLRRIKVSKVTLKTLPMGTAPLVLIALASCGSPEHRASDASARQVSVVARTSRADTVAPTQSTEGSTNPAQRDSAAAAQRESSTQASDSVEAASPPPPAFPTPTAPPSLPRIVDLGADKCIPCKMMAPILEELKREYAGQFDVEFIDVWKNPEPGRAHGIKVIPTQIFFDASGTERFRHEGFFSKEDILKKWAELGVTLQLPQG